MKNCDYWNYLRSGNPKRVERALRDLEEAQAQNPDASHIVELGVAYLWAKQHENAWNHFRSAIETHPRKHSKFYGMAGAALWCSGAFDEAVKQWKAGLKAQYTDTSGLGVHLPMLLFTASVLRPKVLEMPVAETILVQRAKDPRIDTWPGPIARWILNQTNEGQVLIQCKRDDGSVALGKHWLVKFYREILRCREGKCPALKHTMRNLADTSQPEWTDESFFLSCIWSEEFFFAQSEAA